MAGSVVGIGIPNSVSFIMGRLAEVRPEPRSEMSGILEDLAFIKRSWHRIEAVLADAEMREIREKLVKLWLQDLKELAYKADDVLDSYKYQLIANEVEGDLKTERAGNSYSPSSIDSTFRREIAYGVREIKDRFKEIVEEKNALRLTDSEGKMMYNDDMTTALARTTGSQPADPEIFGRKKELLELVQLLLSPSDCYDDKDIEVIAVVGMGGVGKTTIVQHAYQAMKVPEHFDVKAWVYVSGDFDVQGLTRGAVESFTKHCPKVNELDTLQSSLKDAVKGKRFLLVMDDVWNERHDLWEKFVSPLRHGVVEGSKILITTRNQLVVNTVLTGRSLRLEHLSEDNGWLLFKRYAFRNHNEKLEFDTIGRKIVRKCKGLPLAIKVLASLLRQRTNIYDDYGEVEMWRSVLRSDLWDIENAEGGHQIMGPLLLSYLHLPAHLKPCFALCSLFPKDHTISASILIKLWMAHDLLHADTEDELEKLGMRYIDDFSARSLLQYHCSSGNNKLYAIHDLIHDLAQHISGGEYHNDIDSHNLKLSATNVRYLSIRGIFRVQRVTQSLSYSKCRVLRTLWVLTDNDPCHPNRMSVSNHEYFESLRVLNIQTMWTREDPLTGLSMPELLRTNFFKNMKHLRYLTVVMPSIKNFPESITKLYNLQRLDLSETKIAQLSNSIGNLKSLRYLCLSKTEIVDLPEGICLLYDLEHLDISELFITQLPHSLGELCNLRVLNLSGNGCLQRLPESIRNLQNLQKLYMGYCYGLEKLPESIGELHSLQTLNMMGCVKLRKLPKGVVNLSNLQVLDISWCSKISYLPAGIKGLRNLQDLPFFAVGDTATWHAGLPAAITRLKNPQDMLQFLEGHSTRGHVGLPACLTRQIDPFSNATRGLARITELKDLGLRLRNHRLIVTGLHNVIGADALTDSILTNHVCVSELELEWGNFLQEKKVSNQERVLQSLKPHTNLESLTIRGYGGLCLPSWLADPSFAKLRFICLENLLGCSVLSPLNWLPSLEELEIKNMLLSEADFEQVHFPKLEKLLLWNCPQIISFPLYKFFALTSLKIFDCLNLASIDFDCGLLMERPQSNNITSSLTNLIICRCPQLCFAPQTRLPPLLKALKIIDCPLLNEWRNNVISTYLIFKLLGNFKV